MAVLPQMGQEEEEGPGGAGAMPQEQLAGGTAGGVVGGGAGIAPTAGAAAPSRRARAGGYVGLGQYLGAQGEAGSRLAGKVGQTIEKKGEEARKGIRDVGQAFEKQAQGGRAKDISKQIKDDPTQIGKAQYERATSGRYMGPQSLADIGGYGKTAENVRQLGTQLEQVQTAEGQKKFLRDLVGGTGYTSGQSRLDTALLQGTRGARERFAGLREALGGVGGELGAAEQQAQGLVGQYGREAEDIAAQAKAARQEALTGLQSDIDAQVAAENAARRSLYEIQKQGFMADPSVLAKQYGADVAHMGELSGKERAKFFQRGADLGAEQVATEAQKARADALAAMAGDTSMLGDLREKGRAYDIDVGGWEAAAKEAHTARLAREELARQRAAAAREKERQKQLKLQREAEAEMEARAQKAIEHHQKGAVAPEIAEAIAAAKEHGPAPAYTGSLSNYDAGPIQPGVAAIF